MSDKRKVKFNVGIADYRQGQIVDYADMPLGHRFWVDNDSILLDTKICDFIKEPEPETEKPDEVEKADPEADSQEVALSDKEFTDELKGVLESTESETEPDLADSEPKDDTKDKGNELSFNFESESKPICPSKNKDRSPCKRDKLRPNGYCFQHQDQAPTGLTGEAPDNLKDLPGN